jgi:hypothetical protein
LNEDLYELDPDRGSDAIQSLKNLILAQCYFLVINHGDEQVKLAAKFRKDERRFIESGKKALQNIEDLLSFMKKFHPLHRGMNEGANEDLNLKQSIDIDAFLSKYHVQLSEYIRITNKKLLPHWGQHGVLHFPGGLENQTQRKDHQVNGLLFAVAFLLRQYTDKAVSDENWLQRTDGPMPTTGKPHYKLVAEIFNATKNLCKPRIFSNKLSEYQVRKRIKTLVDCEAELSMSIMHKYYQILKDINPSFRKRISSQEN